MLRFAGSHFVICRTFRRKLYKTKKSDSCSQFPNESFRTFLPRAFYTEVLSYIFAADRRQKAVRSGRGTAMMMGPKGCEEDLSSQCSVCGRLAELFELPDRCGRCCLECSADIAAAAILATEIDAATLAGQNVSSLISEYEQLSARLLGRSQSAALGNL